MLELDGKRVKIRKLKFSDAKDIYKRSSKINSEFWL